MSNRRHAVAVADPAREALGNAIAALAEERQRIEQLEAARERAREESWGLPDRVANAELELRRARDSESSRLAFEYASGGEVTEASPISLRQQELEAAKSNLERISRVEAALDRELENAAVRVRRAEAKLRESLADLVLESAAFNQLFNELSAAWGRLRGVIKCFAAIQSSLGGNMPEAVTNRYRATVSLDPLAVANSMGPLPTDNGPVEAWKEALEKLLIDPDAELPSAI